VIEKIENITFPVKDLKRAVAFYENVVGLKKSQEWSNYATFDVGGTIFGLDPDPKAELQVYLRVANVDEEYKTLKQRGLQSITEPKDMYWGGRTATFQDPDGNKLILVSFKEKS
jgi:predicted enzyme related to lactoylglutathione lyase